MYDPQDRVTIKTACEILGGKNSPIDPATYWRWVKSGRVAPPLAIGPKVRRAVVGDLLAVRDRVDADEAA